MPAPSEMLQTKVNSLAVPMFENGPAEAASERPPPSLFSFIGGSTPTRSLARDPEVDVSVQLPKRKQCKPCKHQRLYPLSALPFAAASGPAALRTGCSTRAAEASAATAASASACG